MRQILANSFNMLIFSGEKVDIDTLPPEYHEDINKIVKNFSDEEIKV